MKLSGKILVAVAMMVGSFGAMGCQSNNEVAPEESVQNAPVENEAASTTTTENTNSFRAGFGFGVRTPARHYYYAPHAPPAARYEVRGFAPSARHFWAPGYYRWSGREYVWYPGRWELRRTGYEFIGPRWIVVRGRHQYIPGHWVAVRAYR